jgi:hypothetical protein
LEKELTELKDLLVAEQTRLKKQEENVSALETREKAFSVKVANDADAKATVFDGLIEERREELSKWQKNIEKEGQNFLNKIERFYRLSGDTTLAGRFVEASRLEAYSYYFMTFLSLSFFVGAIWAFLFGSSAIERLVSVAVDGALTAWLARVSLAAIFLVPAGVFSQQAAKHRRASVWYRTLGVRVATLKPYLDEFENGDEGYQEELKEILKAFFVSELKVDTDKRDTTIQLGMLENLFARFGNKTS